jgi:hypothetical protein
MIVVAVQVIVTDDQTTYVDVGRRESVLPITPTTEQAPVTQRDLDVIDLARAALDTIATDVVQTAAKQLLDVRILLGQAMA